MKKQILLILIGIIISLGLMLSSILADDLMIQAQELLEKYSKAPPPELSDPGDWDEIMQSKQAGPMVNCMPHYYSWVGREITIWGNVHWGDISSGNYEWDLGDGTILTGVVADARYIAVTHTYTTGGIKTATLTVTDDNSKIDVDQTTIDVIPISDKQQRINAAIEDGLRWLYLNQNSSGYWYTTGYYGVATTGLAVLAFEENAHYGNNDTDEDIYAETVQLGLDWLLNDNGRTITIGVQTAGDPDTDGDGIGVYFQYSTRDNYSSGIACLAVAASNQPDSVVASGYLAGMTYYEVMEDAMNCIAWSQTDASSGNYRGGWRYCVHTSNYGSSDNSAVQWPVLALVAIEQNMNIEAPSWVADELAMWLDYSQDSNGGFGYNNPTQYLNIAKTGSGIGSHYYIGTPDTNISIQNALDFIDNHWNDTYDPYGWREIMNGNYYALYGLKKAMEFYDITTFGAGPRDWYEEISDYLLDNTTYGQNTDGSWPGNGNWFTFQEGTTATSVLVLVTGTPTGSVSDPTSFTATTSSVSQIDLAWTQNGSSDDVMVAWNSTDTFGTPVDGTSYSAGNSVPGGGTVLYNGSNLAYNHTSLNSNTQYFYKAWSVDGSDNYSTGVTDDAITYKDEPSSHVTDFTATANGWNKIDLSWTENDGSVVPDGYLIKASTSDNVSDPVDGTPVADNTTIGDDSGAINLSHGTTSYQWAGLNEESTYYFKIYPYTNSGSAINYKTDGTVPSANATTEAMPAISNLMLSEVADPSDEVNCKFVELYNYSGSTIDFSIGNWYLCRQANGNPLSWGDVQLTGSISSGSTYIVAYNQTAFETAFGISADLYSSSISGNGNDGYFLYYGGDHSSGVLVDAYGVVDQDGTGEPWEYTDSHAVRNAGVTEPNTTWTASEWTITSATAAQCTPGVSTLPVTLSTFTAQYLNSKPTLYWETQSETDNMGWFIYRNTIEDFTSSEEIAGMIPGHGTTTQPQSYIYEDAKELQIEQTYYYWLESLDYSGTIHHYDRVVNITIPDPDDPEQNDPPIAYDISADPNPFSHTTNISFVMEKASSVDVAIYNIKGGLVKSFNSVKTSQENENVNFNWNGKDDAGKSLSNGVYLYSVKVNGKDYAFKQLILMK